MGTMSRRPQDHGATLGFRDFIEFSIDGLRNWIKTCLAEHQPGLGEADYSIVSGVLRGLLIDFLATGDSERTTNAFQAFLDGFNFGVTPRPPSPPAWFQCTRGPGSGSPGTAAGPNRPGT